MFIFAVTCAIAALVGHLLSVRIENGFRQTRVSESRYRRIFENVEDVYFEMGANGVFSGVSPASASLFGVPREEMIGRSLATYCTDTSPFEELLATTRTHARVSNRELVIGGSDIAPRHVLVEAAGAGTFDFYPQSGKLISSDLTKDHLGTAPETEFDQDLFLNSVHPDDRERIRQAATSLAVGGSDDQLATEYRIIGPDGMERWITVRGRM